MNKEIKEQGNQGCTLKRGFGGNNGKTGTESTALY